MAKTNQITLGRLQILMYLVNRPRWVLPIEVLDNVKPDRITTLHGVRKALNELECVEMKNITPAGRPNYQCRMKTDPETFHILVTKAFDHDRDSQTVFMRSQYCRGMTRDLAQQFVDSTPNKDRYMIAPPSEDDALLVTQSIIADGLRDNWLALKFVTHFISVDSDERSGILSRLMETSLNPVISPTAARNAEYKKGFRSGMEASIQYIDKDKELAFREKRMEAEMKTVIDNYINWTTFFAQLLYLNSNYRYLFD